MTRLRPVGKISRKPEVTKFTRRLAPPITYHMTTAPNRNWLTNGMSLCFAVMFSLTFVGRW